MIKIYKPIAIIISIIIINSFYAKAQCDYELVYKKITKVAKSDTLIIIRDFIPDQINNPQNLWIISTKANTNYKIYFFSETDKPELYLYKITKTEKIIVNSIIDIKKNNSIDIYNKEDVVYQIELKTDNAGKCYFAALFFTKSEN